MEDQITELDFLGLNNLKLKLEKQLSKVNNAISALSEEKAEPIAWTIKAVDCIKNNNRPIPLSDILDCLFYDEPEKLEDKYRKTNYSKALSLALANLVKKEKLVSFSISGFKGYFYAMPEWCINSRVGYILKPKYKKKLKERLLEKE